MIIKIKNFIFSVLYILVIIYLIAFVPILWGHKPLVVISGSMKPTLKVGGILYYHEEKIEDFKVNDILVYKSRNHIISHRIVKKLDNGFITKGDANNSDDPNIINNSKVLGKGTNWSIPYLGLYVDFIYNHKYLLFISILLLLVDLCDDYYINNKKKEVAKYEKS